MFTRMRRIAKLGFTNFWRNRWMSMAAILIITMTLTTMGIFVVLSYFATSASNALKDKVTVQVDFTDSATDTMIQEMQRDLSSQAGVLATYISKEDALKDFQTRSDIKQTTKDLINEKNNPLPRGLKIRTVNLDNLDKVNTIVRQDEYKPYIYNFTNDSNDNKLLIDRVNSGTKMIKQLAAVLTIVFIIVAIFVTLNTVQMAIHARKDEIEIMRLVGAGQAYVRVPFYVEGALMGMLGAAFSFVILYSGLRYFDSISRSYLSGLNIDLFSAFSGNIVQIIIVLLGAGILLGTLCTAYSIRRYVKV